MSLSSTLLFGSSSLKKEDEWTLLESVQNHFFPQNRYPSASNFEALRYLKIVSKHDSFGEKNLQFLKKGAKEIQKLGFKTNLASSQKEKILQEFAKSNFGNKWISMILTYTIEALFSDPIYGGNKDFIGSKSFEHNSGFPRPKNRFGKSS